MAFLDMRGIVSIFYVDLLMRVLPLLPAHGRLVYNFGCALRCQSYQLLCERF